MPLGSYTNSNNSQFPLIISVMYGHNQLKFGIKLQREYAGQIPNWFQLNNFWQNYAAWT